MHASVLSRQVCGWGTCRAKHRERAPRKRALSSSHTVAHLMPMQGSLRARPSPICVTQCWRQQSLQKACPHCMAVASAAATSQKQHRHSSRSLWPAQRQCIMKSVGALPSMAAVLLLCTFESSTERSVSPL